MQVIQFLVILALGAGIGGLLGYFGRCTTGACPLTANPWRGAAFGALFAAILGSSLIAPGGGRAVAAGEKGKPAAVANAEKQAESKYLIHLKSADDFEKLVLQAKTPVVVDFYADWCPPCRMLGPVIEDAAREYKGKVVFVKVNVDNFEELARKYRVRSIPRLILFNGGKQVASTVGYRPLAALKKWIDSSLD